MIFFGKGARMRESEMYQPLDPAEDWVGGTRDGWNNRSTCIRDKYIVSKYRWISTDCLQVCASCLCFSIGEGPGGNNRRTTTTDWLSCRSTAPIPLLMLSSREDPRRLCRVFWRMWAQVLQTPLRPSAHFTAQTQRYFQEAVTRVRLTRSGQVNSWLLLSDFVQWLWHSRAGERTTLIRRSSDAH